MNNQGRGLLPLRRERASSLVLGLVGAGGVGLLINQSIKSFQFDQMLTHIIVILVLIVIVDQASARIRRRLSA